MLYCFHEYALDTDRRELRRDGEPRSVEPKVFDLLVYLLDCNGRVVGKDELIARVWMGRLVSDSALATCLNAARAAIGDSGGSQRLIKTIPRKGIRFVGDVRAEKDPADPPARDASPLSSGPADKPSVAVLPFASLSEDGEQRYFADSLAEDIIARLGRLGWLWVSARISSFAYQGKVIDARQVAGELGVRYVLGGSVRRSGAHLRIGAELSAASTGLQVWAERYDSDIERDFPPEDEIAERIVAAIEPRLYAAESQRLRRQGPETLDAWGLVIRAMPHVWDWGSEQEIRAAQALLTGAIAIDPDFPRASSLLAWTQAGLAQLGSADAREALDAARAMAQQAIQRDSEDPWTHLAAGYIHMVSRSFDQAVRHLTEAIALNPSLAFAHVVLAATYGYRGMSEEGLRHCGRATRLSPRDFTRTVNFSVTGLCHFMAGRYADAVEWERRAVELRPHFGSAWRTLAASAGRKGELDVAAVALSEAKRLHPSLSVEWVEKYHPITDESHRLDYIDGLRAAGLE
ncbi:MAG: winged helix-turn-helix domain-containing protein [Amaricoccus sp.]